MSDTHRLKLPLLAAAQAQKHVTHNEALLRLDVISHPYLKSRTVAVPPAASEGDVYLIPAGASGDWSGHDGKLAEYRNGIWEYFDPFDGLNVFVADESVSLLRVAGSWQDIETTIGEDRLLARAADGAESRHQVIEAELSSLSGAFVETAAIIPDRAIVYCVSTRTTGAVTGATSYNCGLSAEPDKFGGSLGAAPGSSNLGVIGPTAFYTATPVRLTANGGNFTGGTVRMAVHCFFPVAPAQS